MFMYSNKSSGYYCQSGSVRVQVHNGDALVAVLYKSHRETECHFIYFQIELRKKLNLISCHCNWSSVKNVILNFIYFKFILTQLENL